MSTDEYGAGIDINSVVQPLRLRNWSVTINYHCFASIFRGPVITDGQPELICFTGCFPVEAELPNGGRTAPMHLLAKTSMSDNQSAPIQDIVTDQSIQELSNRATVFGLQDLDFRNRLFQSVLNLNLLPAQPSHELHVVVARNAESVAGDNHVANNAKGIENVRPPIHQVTQEQSISTRRVQPALPTPRIFRLLSCYTPHTKVCSTTSCLPHTKS